MAFDLDDYATVAARRDWFIGKHPEGSLQSELKPLERDGVLVGWWCRAYAYRTPDDLRPGIGHAVEPVPGKTPYTRDSEAMNCETSAWGRAINALGFPTEKLASREEVEARQDPAPGKAGPAKRKPRPEAKKAVAADDAGEAGGAPQPPSGAPTSAGIDTTPESKVERDNEEEPLPEFATPEQRKDLFTAAKAAGVSNARLRELILMVTGQETTAQIPYGMFGDVMEAVEIEAVPFQ